MKVAQSCPILLAPWTVAHQAPLSMGFSRQEYWSGLPCLHPGDLPNPGIEPRSPALQADSLSAEPLRELWMGTDSALTAPNDSWVIFEKAKNLMQQHFVRTSREEEKSL